jgi:transcriptional regulator with XRE-family HTH domain
MEATLRAGGAMETPATPTFGALLKRLRLAAGLTQEVLAERAGLSAKAISDLERDPGRLPRLETLALLAEALRLGPEQRARLLVVARPEPVPAEAPLCTDDSPFATTWPGAALHILPRPPTPLRC